MKKFLNKIKGDNASQASTSGTGSTSTGPAASGSASGLQAGVEDPFAALRRYDTVFIVDDSGSMTYLWKQVRDALVGVVEKSVKYDEDGIDLYFFNSKVVKQNLNAASGIKSLFKEVQPRSTTPTATALSRVLEPYLKKLEEANFVKKEKPDATATRASVKPLNVVILTDGAPNPGEEPEMVIVDAAKRLEAIRAPLNQLGLSFVQIGTDMKAQEALTYLDDNLREAHGIRDMVDTTLSPPSGNVSSEYLLKALLGGVNRKLDRQG